MLLSSMVSPGPWHILITSVGRALNECGLGTAECRWCLLCFRAVSLWISMLNKLFYVVFFPFPSYEMVILKRWQELCCFGGKNILSLPPPIRVFSWRKSHDVCWLHFRSRELSLQHNGGKNPLMWLPSYFVCLTGCCINDLLAICPCVSASRNFWTEFSLAVRLNDSVKWIRCKLWYFRLLVEYV